MEKQKQVQQKLAWFRSPAKVVFVVVAAIWLVAFVGLVLAIRLLLAPTGYDVSIMVAWVIAEIFLSIIVLVNLLIYCGMAIDVESMSRSDDASLGVGALFFVTLGFLIASIAMPVNGGFAAWSIVNFIAITGEILIDIIVWMNVRSAD